MPTTALTIQTPPSFWSETGEELEFTAADVANGNHFVAKRDALVVAWNTGVSERTVTITSVADQNTGRTGDVDAQALAAGEIRIFRLTENGWKQSDSGWVLLSANHAEVEFAIINLT